VSPPPHRARTFAGVGLAAAALLVLWGLLAPAPAFQAWLIGFAFWSLVPIGALVLILIHALTGGRWGKALAAALAPAARAVPLLGLLFLPLAFGLPHLYPWAGDPNAAGGSVARLYLNPPAYLVRSAAALAGWAILSVAVLRPDLRRRQLIAGLGLVFHGLAISLVAVDWLLSIDPGFASSNFAADVAITQLLAALAWAALLQPEEDARAGPAADLAGLLLACVLGVLYLAYMQYVVSWYGGLPEKAAWYLRRGQGPWGWIALASFAFGALLPLLALLQRRVRRRPRLLRWVGASILLGLLLRTLWLLGPAFDPSILLAAALAAVAMGGLWIGLAYGPWRPAAAPGGEAARGA
jgi:hypothetical protein